MATVHVLRTPELLYLIGRTHFPPWQYYNRGEVQHDSDLREVLALRTISTDFYHHFVRPFPRTALCISTAHQLYSLFSDVIAFEERLCRCSLSGGDARRGHVNFLNLYLLEVALHNEDDNSLQLWEVAQRAIPYMTNWTELNIVFDNDSSTTMLDRIGHWWRPYCCSIRTLRLKDECSYGAGQFVRACMFLSVLSLIYPQGVAHLYGPSPWESYSRILCALTPFHRLRTLLIDTPTFAYPIPLDIDLEVFVNATHLGVFLLAYDFTPHEVLLYSQLLTVLPHLRRLYLQYLHWQPLGIAWNDPQGGTGRGRMFHVLQPRPSITNPNLYFGVNNLDHFDGQSYDTDPFSDWVGPYRPDPNDPLSPRVYEHPVRLYSSIEGPYCPVSV